MCAKFGANRSSRLTASPHFGICDTLSPPPSPEMRPGVLRGDLYLAYVHFQMNPQTWTKVGANRTASPTFELLTPPSAPLVSRGAICLADIHSHYGLHMCAKFGANRPSRLVAFSRICGKAFRRCTRWLAQKHAKKQHCTSKIRIPPEHADINVTTFFHSNSVARSRRSYWYSAGMYKNWII